MYDDLLLQVVEVNEHSHSKQTGGTQNSTPSLSTEYTNSTQSEDKEYKSSTCILDEDGVPRKRSLEKKSENNN